MVFYSLTFMVKSTHLIHSKVHYKCERNKHYLFVLQEYLIIFRHKLTINWTMFTYGIDWVTYGTPNLRMYHEVSTQLIGNFYKKNKPTFLLLCVGTN